MGTYLSERHGAAGDRDDLQGLPDAGLFDRLGIDKPQWDCCPRGINIGGFGLHLSTRDIAKFGQLLLQDGVWQEERVLPRGWVARATRSHIDNSNCMFNGNIDWGSGYGYQFWRARGGRYRGDGMFGQVCMVDQQQEMVIAITAGTTDMGAEMDLIHDVLAPAAGAPAADKATREKLQRRLKGLGYRLPREDGRGRDLTGSYLARAGEAAAEPDGGWRLGLMLEGGAWRKPASYILGEVSPHLGEAPGWAAGEHPLPYLGSFSWHNGALHLSVRMPGGPYALRAVITPAEKGVDMDLKGAGTPEGRYRFIRQA